MQPFDSSNLENAVMASLPYNGEPVEEALLEDRIQKFGDALGAPREIREKVKKSIESKLAIRMDKGVALPSHDHTPWWYASKATLDPFFSVRYVRYLERRSWPKPVIHAQDQATDEIIDLCGNPSAPGSWKRRGLVIGDVQSGKTATYTSLICKAADAGYKLVILLTGTLESLRKQTQERLEEGFVGHDSTAGLLKKDKRVGVGLIDKNRDAQAFTSRGSDFKAAAVDVLHLSLTALKEPALVVVKKNTKILDNLHEWLSSSINSPTGGKIDHPLLVIDDEADNASVNTSAEEDDPTAINARIRKILSQFNRSTYVGFTATPFANVFIDPESEHSMLGDDLFPADFIYSLDAPTNYFGPKKIFPQDVDIETSAWLREIDDAEDVFPFSHKSSHTIDSLPSSLLRAIDSFIIASTIKDIRGVQEKHRSMLVNVSRFTNVQNQVEMLVNLELKKIQDDVRNFSSLSKEKALSSERIKRLYHTWESEFKAAHASWKDVQASLSASTGPICTTRVNQSNPVKGLDYSRHKAGLRVIAVGGNSLSRGLTLEGLNTSYFYRNSIMYDTLFQMGRWFGYRDGYEDLCRVWLGVSAADWYSHIADANTELRHQISTMREENRSPREFGLQVRAHPDSLIVTARNKMRSATSVERLISLSVESIESVLLHGEEEVRAKNATAVRGFISSLRSHKIELSEHGDENPIFRNIGKNKIIALLRAFMSPAIDFRFQPSQIAAMLATSNDDKLSLWDVVIPNGKSVLAKYELGDGLLIKRQVRRVERPGKVEVISNTSRRVASRGIEREGIPVHVVKAINEKWKLANNGAAVPDKEYREVREKPLLLIHVLDAHRGTDVNARLYSDVPLIALGLSFPRLSDDNTNRVRYLLNVVKLKEEQGVDFDFASDIGDE